MIIISSCIVWFPNPLAAGSQMGTLSSSTMALDDVRIRMRRMAMLRALLLGALTIRMMLVKCWGGNNNDEMITSTSAVNDDIFFIFGKIEIMVVMLIARVLLTRRGICNKWRGGGR